MADSDNDNGGDQSQDRFFLPIANVSRIMKKALPANAKISKDAKETVQECVSEFISFITGEASDKCQREKRKTINGDDLLWAMTTLGFEDYVDPLKVYLQRFRDMEGDKTALTKENTTTATGGGGGGNGSVVNNFHDNNNNNNNNGGRGQGGGGMYHHNQGQAQGGHLYGSPGFYQMGQNPNGKLGSAYPGSGPLNGRPTPR